MKRKVKQVIALACGFGLLCSSAQAATLIGYDAATRTLQIKGDFAESAAGTATFSILPAGVDPQSVDAETANAADMLYRTVAVQDDGSVTSTIVLPADFKNGQYVLRTYQETLCGTNYFGFLGTPVPQSLLQAVNTAASPAAVLSALKALPEMGFEGSVLSKYGSTIGDYVFANRPSGGYTDTALMKAFYMGEAMGRLAAKELGLDEMLIAYSAYVDIDYETEFAALPAEIRKEMISLFAQMERPEGDFTTLYQTTRALAKMKCAASFTVLQEDYLAYAAANGISLGAYHSLSTSYLRDQVFIKLYGRIHAASSMEDVNAMFRTALDEVKKTDHGDSPSNGNGGGFGGGGGGGGSASYLPAEPEQMSDPSKVPGDSFLDTADHWAKDYIAQMKQRGAVNGFEDGTFRPDQSVTRAEFVKMLGELLRLESQTGAVFSDVTEGDWFYGAVYAAYEKGLIRGTAEHEFSPNSDISREDAAVIIQRAWQLPGGGTNSFADSADISDYAAEAVNALTEAGILTGYTDNTIAPKASLTRGETAALLARVLNSVNG